MSTADILAVALGANGPVSTAALVYTVRRVSPWPKPPAQPQPPGSGTGRKRPAANIPAPADPELAAAANGQQDRHDKPGGGM